MPFFAKRHAPSADTPAPTPREQALQWKGPGPLDAYSFQPWSRDPTLAPARWPRSRRPSAMSSVGPTRTRPTRRPSSWRTEKLSALADFDPYVLRRPAFTRTRPTRRPEVRHRVEITGLLAARGVPASRYVRA